MYEKNMKSLKERLKGHKLKYDVFKMIENHVSEEKDHFYTLTQRIN
mgnify:CR=1 FL=1